MFAIPSSENQLTWTGERFVPGLTGEIELEHIHRYLFALQFCHQRDVLDIASGEGYGSFLLARVAHRVMGVDIDEDSIRHAISTYQCDGLSYETGACTNIPADTDSFDIVISFETLEHLADQEKFMCEVQRVLRPDGILVMSTPDARVYSPNGTTDNHFHVSELSEQEFLDLIHRFFPFHVAGRQKATAVSIIEPVDLRPVQEGREYFRKPGNLQFESTEQLADATYMVAVASAKPISEIHWGILDDKDIHRSFEKQLASVSTHNRWLEEQLAAVSTQMVALDDEIVRVSTEIAKRDREVSRLVTELANRDGEIAQLSARVALVMGSRSWRITKPLRGLGPARARLARASAAIQALLFSEGMKRRLWTHQIKRSGLFDAAFYLRSNPDVAASGLDPLAHYLERGAVEGRNPHPLFDTSYYVTSNADVEATRINPLAHYVARGARTGKTPHSLFNPSFYLASSPEAAASGANPLAHFWHVGANEGRCGWSVQDAVRYLKPYVLEPEKSGCLAYLPPNGESTIAPAATKIALYTSSRGNYFFDEIRELVAAGLSRCGAEVVALNELSDRPADITSSLVVAPHEFFGIGEGPKRLNDQWLSDAFMLNTEQLHTPWFAKSLRALAHAPAVFDMNIQSAAGLRQMGIPAYFLPLGWLPDFAPFSPQEVLPDVLAVRSLSSAVRNNLPHADAPLTERPIDVLFVGTPTARRRSFFARNAAALSKHHCFFLLGSNDQPLAPGNGRMTTAAMTGLTQRSKILLNIHRDEFPYFEWHRMVCQGIWHKTLVVTEPCFRVPWLIPGQHYMECDAAATSDMIDWLLETEGGMVMAESMRVAAFEVLMRRYRLDDVLGAALSRVMCPTMESRSKARYL